MVLHEVRDWVKKAASARIWCSAVPSRCRLWEGQKYSGYSHWPKESPPLGAEWVINSSEGALSHCSIWLLETAANWGARMNRPWWRERETRSITPVSIWNTHLPLPPSELNGYIQELKEHR